jgi:hypothetical protein
MNSQTKWFLTAGLAAIIPAAALAAPARAAQVKALGMILDAQNAHVGPSATSAGTTIFSGDILSTDIDGDIKVRIGQTTYELVGDTSAAFFAGQNGPIAELRRGTLKIADNSPEGFQIYASDVRIVSDQPRPIQGEVSFRSPCELEVRTSAGQMDVVAGSEKRSVDHDHAYRVMPEHSVPSTQDKAVSPEDPDYHKNHTHAACAAVPWAQNGGKVIMATASSHFGLAAGVVAGVVIIPIVYKAFESPDRP